MLEPGLGRRATVPAVASLSRARDRPDHPRQIDPPDPVIPRVGHEQVSDRIDGDPVRTGEACLGGRNPLSYRCAAGHASDRVGGSEKIRTPSPVLESPDVGPSVAVEVGPARKLIAVGLPSPVAALGAPQRPSPFQIQRLRPWCPGRNDAARPDGHDIGVKVRGRQQASGRELQALVRQRAVIQNSRLDALAAGSERDPNAGHPPFPVHQPEQVLGPPVDVAVTALHAGHAQSPAAAGLLIGQPDAVATGQFHRLDGRSDGQPLRHPDPLVDGKTRSCRRRPSPVRRRGPLRQSTGPRSPSGVSRSRPRYRPSRSVPVPDDWSRRVLRPEFLRRQKCSPNRRPPEPVGGLVRRPPR